MTRLYMILDEAQNILSWAGTQGDARKAKKARVGAKEWREIEVPTKKPDLVKFLNDNFSSSTQSSDLD